MKRIIKWIKDLTCFHQKADEQPPQHTEPRKHERFYNTWWHVSFRWSDLIVRKCGWRSWLLGASSANQHTDSLASAEILQQTLRQQIKILQKIKYIQLTEIHILAQSCDSPSCIRPPKGLKHVWRPHREDRSCVQRAGWSGVSCCCVYRLSCCLPTFPTR